MTFAQSGLLPLVSWGEFGQWLAKHWLLLLPLLPGCLALWWLLPQLRRRPMDIAVGFGIAALVAAWLAWIQGTSDMVFDGLFTTFAGLAVLSAACMITQPNPVYSALWFAVVILNVCGLFVLQAAPFLSAATIIVYAGAVVVTFLFVIMLAQQSGETAYDRQAYQPWLASLGGFLLMGSLVYVFSLPAGFSPATTQAEANTTTNLGRTLYVYYLLGVELAGTLLTVAVVGALAIAPRRERRGAA